MFKLAGIIIPAGQYITISAKPTGIYSAEITAEYQVPSELLYEKFKHHPVYIRVIINIIKDRKFDRLHLPLPTTKAVAQIEGEAEVDWNKIANNGAKVLGGIVLVSATIGAIILLSGASVGASAGYATIMAATIGIKSLSCMYSEES